MPYKFSFADRASDLGALIDQRKPADRARVDPILDLIYSGGVPRAGVRECVAVVGVIEGIVRVTAGKRDPLDPSPWESIAVAAVEALVDDERRRDEASRKLIAKDLAKKPKAVKVKKVGTGKRKGGPVLAATSSGAPDPLAAMPPAPTGA